MDKNTMTHTQMNKKIILLISRLVVVLALIFLISLISGCSSKNNSDFTCNTPYILAWSSSGYNCCPDYNSDNICDSSISSTSSESKIFIISERNTEKNIIELSNDKARLREEKDMYDVKKAVWDREKEEKQKLAEIEETTNPEGIIYQDDDFPNQLQE